jgi:hypothetical protein
VHRMAEFSDKLIQNAIPEGLWNISPDPPRGNAYGEPNFGCSIDVRTGCTSDVSVQRANDQRHQLKREDFDWCGSGMPLFGEPERLVPV